MSRIITVMPVNYDTGYGVNACRKVLGLLGLGHEVYIRAASRNVSETSPVPYAVYERIIPAEQPDPWELVIMPPKWQPTPGKKTVCCTTLETTRISKEAVAMLNLCQAVVVPCKWNQESLAACGVTVPIQVVPESVDTELFRFFPKQRGAVFTFGAAGVGSRKNMQAVVDAFQKAFPRGTAGSKAYALTIRTDEKHRPETWGDLRIKISTKALPPAKMLEWYARLDVFVNASHGEAWGRHMHEAMAVGRPCVTPVHGGQAEFLGPNTCYPVAFKECPAFGTYKGMGRWIDCEVSDIAKAMLTAVLDINYPAMQRRVAASVAEFTGGRAALALEEILLRCGAVEPVPKPEPAQHPIQPVHDLRIPPEEIILRYYADKRPVPKMPIPPSWQEKNLTNRDHSIGIGDLLILTPILKAAAEQGRTTKIWSESPLVPGVMKFVPEWTQQQRPPELLNACVLQAQYDMGAGHFIQRLHRAFGYKPPLKPVANIVVPGAQKVKGRCALHFFPGRHAKWQKVFIHPKARELYDENVAVLDTWMHHHRHDMEFVEIGPESKFFEQAHHQPMPLEETIRFLATCEYFIGIVSGPMHLAAALGCKCITILNFPDPRQIILPTLVDVPCVESEWLLPQNVHLHQDGDGPLCRQFSAAMLEMAVNGQVYPGWRDDYLTLLKP